MKQYLEVEAYLHVLSGCYRRFNENIHKAFVEKKI